MPDGKTPATGLGLIPAIRDANLTENVAQFTVLITLASYANPAKGWASWPGISTLVACTHISERTLRQAIRDLARRDVLRCQQRPKNSTIYYLNAQMIRDAAAVQRKLRADERRRAEFVPASPYGDAMADDELLAAITDDIAAYRRSE